MAIQESTTLRNAKLDIEEITIGTLAVLKVFTGAQPASCAAANTGTELASMTLPSDWMNAAGAGSKTKLGTWATTGLAAGTAGHWRLYASDGTTCHKQGAATGDGVTFSNTNIAIGQAVAVSAWTLSQPGA